MPVKKLNEMKLPFPKFFFILTEMGHHRAVYKFQIT